MYGFLVLLLLLDLRSAECGCCCTRCAGPLSEVGDQKEADIHSVYDIADSELMSSDGAEQVPTFPSTVSITIVILPTACHLNLKPWILAAYYGVYNAYPALKVLHGMMYVSVRTRCGVGGWEQR